MAASQLVAEFGDSRVLVRKLLTDHQRLRDSTSASDLLPVFHSRRPRL